MINDNNKEILGLLYRLAEGKKYNPPRYSAVKEFVPSLPKLDDAHQKFVAEPAWPKLQWQPEPPYPRYYTDSYKKTILSSL